MSYYGSWKINDVLTFTVNTHSPTSGAATDADAVPTYRVYEDETATPILTGSMALIDSANTVGFYSEQISLTAANGFEKGKSYNIYITAAVGGTSGTISHDFQMEAEVDANIVSDKTGYSVATGGIVAGSFAAAAIDAAAIATDAIGAAELATDAVNEIRDAILADSTAFNGASIAAILADTDDIQLRIPSVLTTGTADSGSTTTMVDAARTEADTDYWKGMAIRFTSGTVNDQVRLITAFTPGTDTITFAPATTQAVATNTYEILPWSAVDARLWNGTALNNLVAGAVDADISAIQSAAITAAAIATDAIGAAELATDAINEIRDAILSDSTAFAGANIDAAISSRATPAQVNAEVDTALADANLDHLVGTASGIPAIPSGTYLDQLFDDGTASYDRTTDSLQAIRDRGDAAWITGGGGGITDILNIQPLIPESIDLANTAIFRLGLMLINSIDDLPATAEITPGTISIDRKAIGGTSWSAIVTDAACSELAGLIFFDEVFDSGTGYVEGDSIRITFKSQKVVVAANDYDISDSNGRIFYTDIRQTMRGTNSASTHSAADVWASGTRTLSAFGFSVDISTAGVQAIWDALTSALSVASSIGKLLVDNINATISSRSSHSAADARTEMDSNSTQLTAIVADTNELQGDWVNGGRLDAILDARSSQATADAIEADTQDIQARLPSALVSGKMDSDTVAISGSAVAADRLEASALTIVSGAAAAGTLSTTQMTTNLTEATDDHYNGRIIIWTSGALKDQASDITDYAGSNFMLTFTAVTEAPVATDTFILV